MHSLLVRWLDENVPPDASLRLRPAFACRVVAVILTAVFAVASVQTADAQGDEGVMEVAERGEEEEAIRINLDFVNADLNKLIRFLSDETQLTIIATEQDIQGKKLSMVNLRNVTIPEALERIKSGLMQFGLTTIQTDQTLIITTIQKAVRMKVPVSSGADPDAIPDSDQVITHVIPLTHLQASELSGPIKEMVSEAGVLFGDKASNSLVITDIASNIRRIATMISSMDEEPTVPYKVKVITLTNAEADKIAQALQQLFREEGQQGFGAPGHGPGPEEMRKMMEMAASEGLSIGRGRILIASSDDTNQLIVRASEENIAIIETLVKQLDTAPALQMEFRVYRLKYGSAEDVVEDLEDILEGTSSGRGERRPWWAPEPEGDTLQGIVGEVRIAADERLNGIIVGTDPRNYTIIDTLVQEIDQEDRPAEEIEIFFLQYADATEVVSDINALIQGQDEDEWMPWWMRWEMRDQMTEELAFGLRGQVNLTADERLNAVIAATSAANLAVLKDLIAQLDVNMPDQEWGTRIYPLQYADAENVSNLLNSVYQGSQSGRGGGFFSFLPTVRQSRTQGSLSGNVVAEAYPTINAIIVSTSTARNFTLIQEFVDQLDVPTPAEQREVTRVIPLEYATASSLEQLLNELWEEGQDQGFSFGRAVSRGFRPEQNDINSLSGKVTVFADSDTNSLVVTTRARYLEDLKALIEQLDIIRGQVWIDVTILEVTLDDSTKLGLEMELTEKRLFGVDAFGKASTPGKNPLTGTFSSALNLGQEITGFSVALATNEYLAFLHTLMRRNKVRTLSRVPLVVRDNQMAEFSSGRDIPYLQSARSSDLLDSQLFDFAFLQDVGITVQITPHIARGRVAEGGTRTIGLQIAQIAVSNFLEFTNFNAPVTEDSHVSTYIDAEDGQQIVIGGLKKLKRQEVEEKVPVLGDIPLLGALFHRTENVVQESEVVMVITPHIVSIDDPSDQARLEQLQRERFGSDTFLEGAEPAPPGEGPSDVSP